MQMNDIFNEVSEDLRRDRAMAALRKWGPALMGLAIALVLGSAAYQGWRYYEREKTAAAYSALRDALDKAANGQVFEAEAALGNLITEGKGGASVLARFYAASEQASRDADAGAKSFEVLAADASIPVLYKHVAQLRAAWLRLDSLSVEEQQKRLSNLLNESSPLRHLAREVMAHAALKAGDKATAEKWLRLIEADLEAPQALRTRASRLSELTRVGG